MMEYYLKNNINYDIDNLERHDNVLMINTKFPPQYIIAKDCDLKITKVLDQNCIIRSILLKYRNIQEKVIISKVYLIDTIHPNAIKIKHSIYPDIQINHSLYEYCIDKPIIIDNQNDIDKAIKNLIYSISFWNFQSCWWYDYSKVVVELDDDEMIYDKIEEQFISPKRLKRRIKANMILNNLKKPLSYLLSMKQDDVIEGGMDFLKMFRVV